MTKTTALCPDCGSDAVRQIGPIPPSNTFAGRTMDSELDGGRLWECRVCALCFRYPHMSKVEIDQLYRSGNTESWQAPITLRTDWQLLKKWLANQKDVNQLLDVGCFDGRLLEFLGSDYTWLGVEIHPEAAQRAQEKGVHILGSDFAHLPAPNPKIDVALAVDVIEHSLSPKAFLTSLAACIRPGGFIAITTGNTKALSWRLMGSRYWYCHIAEHMSFINPSWASHVAPQLGLEVEYLKVFSHAEGTSSLGKKAYEAAVNLLLRFAPRLFALLRRAGLGGIDLNRYPNLALAPPYWMSAKDHMLVVFRKCLTP